MRIALLASAILAFALLGCVQTGPSQTEYALQTQVSLQGTQLAILKEQQVRATIEITPTPPEFPPAATPTYAIAPTQTPVIIVATATTRPMPRVFLEISGSGDLVTENYEWGYCQKAVFYWTGSPLGDGGNLFVHLYKVGTEYYESLVSETIYEPFDGQTVAPLSGGVYYFAILSPEVSWTIRGECQD